MLRTKTAKDSFDELEDLSDYSDDLSEFEDYTRGGDEEAVSYGDLEEGTPLPHSSRSQSNTTEKKGLKKKQDSGSPGWHQKSGLAFKAGLWGVDDLSEDGEETYLDKRIVPSMAPSKQASGCFPIFSFSRALRSVKSQFSVKKKEKEDVYSDSESTSDFLEELAEIEEDLESTVHEDDEKDGLEEEDEIFPQFKLKNLGKNRLRPHPSSGKTSGLVSLGSR
eukprot:snap_masked-scaffold_29-processed-gene-3.9-mRNA-1 protein AED:1.00 eAED:1.00 QI:0/-1/0/0/-1/1/1/0/220